MNTMFTDNVTKIIYFSLEEFTFAAFKLKASTFKTLEDRLKTSKVFLKSVAEDNNII